LRLTNKYLDAVRVERTFIADALAKGRQEEKFNIARSMKAEGIPLSIIAKCTGLPEDIIEAL